MKFIALCAILVPAACFKVKGSDSVETVHHHKRAGPGLAKSDAPDDMPELPAVASMVGAESDTMQDIASQADSLHARVVQIQTENEANLAKQRAIYEHQLKKQDRNNRGINATNANTQKEIEALQASNIALKNHGSDLQKSNERIVSEIQTLEAKVGASNDFLAASLIVSESKKKAEATPVVAEKPAAVAALQHEDKSDDSEDDADDSDDAEPQKAGTSFLALRSSMRRTDDPPANLKDLVSILTQRVHNFALQGQDSQAKLKASYDSAYNAGETRRSALLADQLKFNATRTSLLSQQAELQASDKELQDTKTKFQQRLRGFGLFLQRLAHVALAPENMAPQLLQDLPDNISDGSIPAAVTTK